MSEHLVSADDVRAFDAAERAGFVRAHAEEVAGKARKTYLTPIADAVSAIDRRGELLGLVEAYRRLKADLGLMDFSDQIELGARLASAQPDVGVAERGRRIWCASVRACRLKRARLGRRPPTLVTECKCMGC